MKREEGATTSGEDQTRHRHNTQPPVIIQRSRRTSSGWDETGDDYFDSREPSEWMIHPESNFRRSWDALITVLILYCGTMLPVYIAFGIREWGWLQLIDRLVDCSFMLDVVLNFFTGYSDRGIIVMDQAMVASTYCRSWLAVDVISSIPADIILSPRSLTNVSNDSLIRLHALLRLLKIARLIRLQRILARLQLVCYIRNSLLTVISISLMWTLYTHWFACGFIYLARLEGYEEHAEFKELHDQQATGAGGSSAGSVLMAGMEGQIDIQDVESMVAYYVLALYHVVMVMLTIDMMYRPENSLERLFTVTFGGIGTGLLVYGTTVIVQQFMANNEHDWQADSKLDAINEMVMKHQLRMGTGTKLSSVIEFSKNRLIPSEVEAILKEMPKKLREDALLDLYEPVLACRKFFPRLHFNIIGSALYYMEPRCYAPGEEVILDGKPAKGLFLICNGILHRGPLSEGATLDEDNGTAYRLGDIVGEAALINLEGEPVPEQETVSAVELADVHQLSRAHIVLLMEELPEELSSQWNAAITQMALLAKVKYVVTEGTASGVVQAETRGNHHSSGKHTDASPALEQKRSSASLDRQSSNGDMSSPAELRVLLDQLRVELEAEKGKLEEERLRVNDLEDELDWSTARIQELEEEIAGANSSDTRTSLHRALSP